MTSYQKAGYKPHRNQKGERHGNHTVSWSNFTYDGNWYHNKKHGKGKLYRGEIVQYDGNWSKDQYHGRGKLRNNDLDYYKGSFYRDLKHGQGEEEFVNGNSYKGTYKKDKFHGEGTFKNKRTGYQYVGGYSEGLKKGHGFEEFKKGNTFEGQFESNMRCGYGIFQTKDGYSYQGQWRNNVKQGYGIERNIPISENLHGELKTEFLYEGEFWNGLRDGIGIRYNNVGDYYYGGWVRGKREGLGLMYSQKDKRWELGTWVNDKSEKKIKYGDGQVPPSLNGYRQFIMSINNDSDEIGDNFKDKEYKNNSNTHYLLSNHQLLEDLNIETQEIRWVRLSNIIDGLEFVPEIHDFYGNQVKKLQVAYGKLCDIQVVVFLIELIKRPEIVENIINMYSSPDNSFYCLNMYMNNFGILQKTALAVDDFVPISEDSSNLFSQLEFSKSGLLSILEKVWIKYVHVHGFKPKNIIISRIAEAFLGVGTKSFELDEKTKPSELKEYFSEEGFSFAYLRKEKADLLSKDSLFPYKIKEIVTINDEVAVIFDVISPYYHLDNQEGKIFDDLREKEEYNELFKFERFKEEQEEEKATNLTNGDANFYKFSDQAELESTQFVFGFEKFLEYFETAHFVMYKEDTRVNSCSHTGEKPSKGIRMINYYFSFESYINTDISIFLNQAHLLHQGCPDQKVNLPVRIIMGRYSLSKVRITTSERLKSVVKMNRMLGILNDQVSITNFSNKKEFSDVGNQLKMIKNADSKVISHFNCNR